MLFLPLAIKSIVPVEQTIPDIFSVLASAGAVSAIDRAQASTAVIVRDIIKLPSITITGFEKKLRINA